MSKKKQNEAVPPERLSIDEDKDESMLERFASENSKQELIEAIVHSKKNESSRITVKSPGEVLEFIESRSETIETLALKAGISERELLLAIRDKSDIETRKKIAEALNTTYYSVFGK